MLRLGFLASNNGSLMQAIVAAIEAGILPTEACLIVSNKAEAGAVTFGRHRNIPVQIIPTLPDPEKADQELCEALQKAEVELVILSGYLRKLGPQTLTAFAGRILNTHPSLLPKFGGQGMYGKRVHEAVLAAKETVTGATIHLVDGEYDQGRIIAQRPVAIPDPASVEIVEKLVMAAEDSLFIETLVQIKSGTFAPWI